MSKGGEMSEERQFIDGLNIDHLYTKWNLVVDYRAASNGIDSLAYKSALMKASSIKNQVMIRSYRKNNFTYWEVWEHK